MDILQYALLGLGAGAIYSMLGQGIVLIYRSGVLNFAHGAYAMAGAYIYYELVTAARWAVIPALVASVVSVAVLGVLTHLLIMRPLRHAATLVRIIATLGILSLLTGLAFQRYGGGAVTVPELLPAVPVDVFGMTIVSDRLYLLAIAVIVTVVLSLVGRYTRFGLAMTAATENPRAAATLGWSPDLIASINWAAGGALAAAAGVFVTPIIGLQANTLTLLVLVAMAACLLANFRSYPMVLFAGLGIGMLQSLVDRYVSFTGASAALPFVLIILVLVFRGRGIPARGDTNDRLPGVGTGRVRLLVVAVISVAVIAGTALLFDLRLTSSIIVLATASVILLSIVVVTGYAGQLSLAQFALAGLAVFIASRLVADLGWSMGPAMIVGVVGVVPIGLVFALPALRTRGVTLGVVTLGLGVAAQALIFENTALAGGINGIPVGPANLFGIDIDARVYPERYALFCLVLLILAGLVVANVRRNVAGRRMIAIRSNERAAASVGIAVVGVKLYAFGLSSALAGLGGILLAFQYENVVLGRGFDPLSSITGVGNAVVGGLGFIPGAIVGGTFVSGSPTALILEAIGVGGNWLTVIGGAAILITLLTNPDGVVGQFVTMARTRRLARVSREAGPMRRDSTVPARVRSAALTVSGLTVRFGGVAAVDSVDLVAQPGQVTGLIGPNGAGKTTIIDAITGYVKVAGGTVRVGDVALDNRSPSARARAGVCRSFQSLELFEDMTVLENLLTATDSRSTRAYFTSLAPNRRSPLPPAATAAVVEFGLSEDLERFPSELPYGRRRLVGIARAVATSPSVLLLDEPAAGLDDTETAQLAALIRRLAEDWGIAVLLVEHDMSLVMSVCDRVVVVEFGHKIADDVPAVVRRDPAVVAAYLGVPEGSIAAIAASENPQETAEAVIERESQ